MSCQTLTAPALVEHLRQRAAGGDCALTVLVPGGEALPPGTIERAVAQLHEAGVDVRILVGASDPLAAVEEAWVPGEFHEVIVATLPARGSRWLAIDLPYRVQRITGSLVTHVVASPQPAPIAAYA
ncbi:MAG TPA: hypothetical protein VHX88_05000 [Solirubrobacteraceae bacterium]|nr:hypothetical protein [Solirubrobacteraceae bacterium]